MAHVKLSKEDVSKIDRTSIFETNSIYIILKKKQKRPFFYLYGLENSVKSVKMFIALFESALG